MVEYIDRMGSGVAPQGTLTKNLDEEVKSEKETESSDQWGREKTKKMCTLETRSRKDT